MDRGHAPNGIGHLMILFQRRKSDANKQDFEIKLKLTYRFNQPPKQKGS